MADDFKTLKLIQQGGVLRVTLSNPPANVMSLEMFQELALLTEQVESDDSVRVLVFDSADPEFFIAHFDVELILTFPTDEPAQREQQANVFHVVCERLRTMSKVTIAMIAGRAGGGGNEFAASCDMRFGVSGRTVVNQMEVALGILPGGSGTQMLPRLIGRGRAMEICLGCEDIDAQTALQWGYLNRVFADEALLEQHVSALADRIASFPDTAIALCKASINDAELPLQDGLREEAYRFQQTLRTDAAQKSMRAALDLGLQTRAGELEVADLVAAAAQGRVGQADSQS